MELLPSQPYCPGEPQVYGRGPFEEGLSTFRQGSFALRVLGLLRMKIVVAKYLVAQINPMKVNARCRGPQGLCSRGNCLLAAQGDCLQPYG